LCEAEGHQIFDYVEYEFEDVIEINQGTILIHPSKTFFIQCDQTILIDDGFSFGRHENLVAILFIDSVGAPHVKSEKGEMIIYAPLPDHNTMVAISKLYRIQNSKFLENYKCIGPISWIVFWINQMFYVG
jgi:hypothetical protein